MAGNCHDATLKEGDSKKTFWLLETVGLCASLSTYKKEVTGYVAVGGEPDVTVVTSLSLVAEVFRGQCNCRIATQAQKWDGVKPQPLLWP